MIVQKVMAIYVSMYNGTIKCTVEMDLVCQILWRLARYNSKEKNIRVCVCVNTTKNADHTVHKFNHDINLKWPYRAIMRRMDFTTFSGVLL